MTRITLAILIGASLISWTIAHNPVSLKIEQCKGRLSAPSVVTM